MLIKLLQNFKNSNLKVLLNADVWMILPEQAVKLRPSGRGYQASKPLGLL